MTRARLRTLTTLASLAVLCATAHEARAQAGTTEYAPSDVLLLLDTSGSMAYTTVREPEDPSRYGLPRCGPSVDSRYPVSGQVSFNADASFTTGASPADRWSILVNAFTGTIEGPQCAAQDRTGVAFSQEFGLGTNPSSSAVPYDKGYYLPFNRIVATGTVGATTKRCTPAPSWHTDVRSMTNAMEWPEVAPVYWRDMDAPFDPGVPCPFDPQDTDGIIDRLQSAVRFGIMTFDPTPRRTDTGGIGTGMSSSFAPEYVPGIADTWSYFDGWLTSTTNAATGWPNDCAPADSNLRLYEVGARNPAAPPWEGRLIGFGDPQATTEEMIVHNERVQQAILGMRPFGGTPVAGMLADAYYFMTQDTTTPANVGDASFYGGKVDTNVWMDNRTKRGCRKRIAILITDGGPNLDLQPHCDPLQDPTPPGNGKCPYRTPVQIADDLYQHNIDLFVVGFSVTATSGASKLTCADLMDSTKPTYKSCTLPDLAPCTSTCGANKCAYGYCVTTPEQELLAVCCNLEAIANAGSRYTAEDVGKTPGTGRSAYWAESGPALLAAVTNILRFPSSAMTRTQPVFATGNVSASNLGGTMKGARFFSSFDPIADDLYAGHLVRERYECLPPSGGSGGSGGAGGSGGSGGGGALVATEVPISATLGDYFEVNVDGAPSTFANRKSRRVYTVVAETDPTETGVIYSDRSVRPLHDVNTSDPDGLGTIGGATVNHVLSDGGTALFGAIPPTALFGSNDCTSSASLCCPRIAPNVVPSAIECRNRILTLQLGFDPGDPESNYVRTSAFGAMINSTPELVLTPSEYLRDESYTKFQKLFADRPPMIYSATADGQLHAFVVNQVTNDINELWSFMPPAVLPSVGDQFPTRYAAANKTLLSGPIVATEVAGTATVDGSTGRFLTRSAPLPNAADATQWYSVLVGTFGSTGGYYALDVTNPNPATTKTGYTSGPRFLWQLTTDDEGNPLFGARSTRPAVATLYFVMPGSGTGAPAAQHAVAILPGGYGGSRSTDTTETTTYPTGTVAQMDVTHRTATAKYSPVSDTMKDKLSLAGARSLSIVRLDTGEVIRTFRRSGTYSATTPEGPKGLYDANRVTAVPFAAPMIGNIVSYPNTPGSVADRAFIGDAEGRLWRIDLSSAEPQDWSVTLFHDAFPATGSFTLDDIGPIETPPILSTDPLGRLTIAISTGEQTSLTSKGKHSVWSLSEWRQSGQVASHVNWFLDATNAKNSTLDARDKTEHFTAGTGERVTGPMALFASTLYFTTYNPSSIDQGVCSPGNSYLWGVHYLQAGTTGTAATNVPANGPMPQFTDAEVNPIPSPNSYVRVIPLVAGGIAFGVGVMQKPSCLVTTNTDDPFLGLSNHQTISSVNAGAFQLIVQVGANAAASDKKVRVDTFDLAPPSARSIIDSWAAILD